MTTLLWCVGGVVVVAAVWFGCILRAFLRDMDRERADRWGYDD